MTKKLLTQRIKSLRESRGWTQLDLEHESGVAQAHISRLETGKSPSVSAAILGQIADALGVSVDFLMGRSDIPAVVAAPNHPALKDSRFVDIADIWTMLTDLEFEPGLTALHKAALAFKVTLEAKRKPPEG